MGLDMYLKASKYVGGWEHTSEEEKAMFRKILRAAGIAKSLVTDGAPSLEVQFNVAYWRKANAIHKWFVDNVQGGKDECQTSPVRREQLNSLKELCEKVLDSKDASLLPPESGFFFGSTEIDKWYWDDIRNTIKQLRAILNAPALQGCDFQYEASW